MSQSIWFLFRFFTPRVCELGLPLGTPWTPQKLDWMLSYFADCIQILVLAALSWADGWKSTAIRKITTEPIQVKLLLIVPIRCPNPQSSGVKNRSQQPNFFEIPNVDMYVLVLIYMCTCTIKSVRISRDNGEYCMVILQFDWGFESPRHQNNIAYNRILCEKIH